MRLLDGLNPQQREAVTAGPGPTLILAGPGSGKTRVLTHRIAYLIRHQGVPPHKIMAVTFTNKAAREMKSRVEGLLEGHPRGLTLGTFHSICARLLRREAAHLPVTADFVIFDESDQLALVRQALKELNLNDKQYPPQRCLNKISAAKNELIGPEAFAASTYFAEITKRVYARYQQLLIANNALDFDDLLMGVVRLFDAHPDVLAKYQHFYDHILVDEFQDTNTAQYAFLRQMAAKHRNLYAVGDPDQCFPPDTPIHTATGLKPIEQIRAGEPIVAASGCGATRIARVNHVEQKPYSGKLLRIKTRGGHSFRATPHHLVFARLGWKPGRHDNEARAVAQPLRADMGGTPITVGAFLVAAPHKSATPRFSLMPASHLHPSVTVAVCQDGNIVEEEVVEVRHENYAGMVYDLEVDTLHNYVAGGIVVHNSIYRWRGADYRNVHRFQEDYPDARTILLEENYRSTQIILDAAMAVMAPHPGRTRKRLFTHRQGGAEIFAYEAYNEAEEAQFVVDTITSLTMTGQHAPGDCAVMYRTNAQSRAVEEAFLRAGLPYRLVGAQRFYGRKEIKDLIAYLRLIHNSADTVSLLRVINTPPRGIGAKTLEQLQAIAGAAGLAPADILRDLGEHGNKSRFAEQFGGKAGVALANFGRMLNHWHTARNELSVVQLIDSVLDHTGYKDYIDDGTDEGEERWENIMELRGVAAEYEAATLTDFLQEVALVSDQDTMAEAGKAPTLLTLHAAKGLEFPVVFILGLDEGVLPHQRSFDDPEAMHEERRLMYVGMTRAKDRLYLLRAFRRSLYGDSSLSTPSRFLDDIPDRLLTGNLVRQKFNTERRYKKATTWDTTPRSRSFNLSPRTPDPPDQSGGRHKSGQRVRHAQFGEGIVIESKVVGGEEEVIVAFDEIGIKRLAASIANLEILKG